MRHFQARSMSEAGLGNFKVTGGPLASEQTMGWHITDERGMTVAVANSSDFVALLQLLETIRYAIGLAKEIK